VRRTCVHASWHNGGDIVILRPPMLGREARICWRTEAQPENRLRRSKRVEFNVRRSDNKKDNCLNIGFNQIEPSRIKLMTISFDFILYYNTESNYTTFDLLQFGLNPNMI